jgi:hypothetical protein
MTKVLSSREQMVIDALEKYTDQIQAVINKAAEPFPDHAGKVAVTWGTKFYKVIVEGKYQRSVHSFVDRKTGQLYKPAGWAAPSKTTNYNIVDDMKYLVKDVDPYGAYLYKRNPFKAK